MSVCLWIRTRNLLSPPGLGGLRCVLYWACFIRWDQHGLLTLKVKSARQLADNAYLSWTCSVLRAGFVRKAKLSWVKLKRHSRSGSVSGVLLSGVCPNKQTDNPTYKEMKGLYLYTAPEFLFYVSPLFPLCLAHMRTSRPYSAHLHTQIVHMRTIRVL